MISMNSRYKAFAASLQPAAFQVGKSGDQASGQNEGEVFLIYWRSFCPSFILAYIIYAFQFLPKLRTERSLILRGNCFSLVSL